MGLFRPVDDILLALLFLLIFSRGLGLLFRRVNVSPVVGEVLGGIVLSPLVLGILTDFSDVQTFAEFAVIVVMFHSGLYTDFSAFRSQRWGSILIGALGVAVTFALIFTASLLVLSFSLETSLFLGAIISNSAIEVSSTVLRHTRFKRLKTLVVGASFVDDIMAVFVLGVVLTFVRTTPGILIPVIGNVEGIQLTLLSLSFTSLQVGLFLILTFFVLTKVSHKVLDRIVPRGFEVLLSFGFFLAFSLGIVSKWVGLHEVIGVYIAGLLLSSWSQVPDPMMKRGVAFMKFKTFFTRMTESLFSPIFFGVVGIMLGSALVTEGGGSVPYVMLGSLALFLLAIAGKSIGCGLGARLKGTVPSGAMLIGVAMWGRGALELILIKTGLREGFISPEEFSMVILMTMLTILITPLAYRLTVKWKEDQLEDAGL